MRRRVLTIGMALALAVAGTFAVFAYVRGADARAAAGQQPVTVLVAGSAIPGGTPVAVAEREGLLRAVTMPAATVPPDAVPVVTGDLAGLVTGADLAAGQLLLRPMLVPATASGGLTVPDGTIAVSVALCVPQGVAGHVRPGSRIVVFDTVVDTATEVSAQAGCAGPHKQQFGAGARTRVVLPDVLVLAVGPAPAPAAAEGDARAASTSTPATGDGVLVTVAVDQAGAEKLVTLTQTGLPYLALHGAASIVTVRN